MYAALLVSRNTDASKHLSEILNTLDYSLVDCAFSGSEGRRRLQERDYDLVLINTPLTDEWGVELAIDLSELSSVIVILLVKAEMENDVEEEISGTPIYLMTKPIKRQFLVQQIRFVQHSQQKIDTLQKQNDELQKKMDEIKIIYRAKLIIMKDYNMTEKQAHRYIQKHAMDTRKSPREIAERVIKSQQRK